MPHIYTSTGQYSCKQQRMGLALLVGSRSGVRMAGGIAKWGWCGWSGS
jgi:hypothetical protein